jgi:CHAT domain-containing protein/tetratricopeptide (TPR) repeat protein
MGFRFLAGAGLGLLALASVASAQDPHAVSIDVARARCSAYVEAGRWEDAVEIARRALLAHPEGSHSVAGLELRGYLMVSHFRRGEAEEAEAVQREVVEIRRDLEPGSRQLADDLNDLALVLDYRGDDAGAADAWRESVGILRLLDTADPEDIAGSLVPRLSALAEKERRLGRYDTAEGLMRDAIAGSEEYLPADGEHARLLNNLGALLWDEHRYDEASELLREALRLSEADSAADPGRLPVALHNLANLNREQGRLEEADELHRRALSLARTRLAGDPRLAVFLEEAAVVAAELGRADEAEALFDEGLAAAGAAEDPLARAEILYERGRARLATGDRAGALSDLRDCLGIREDELGGKHPDTAQARVGLGLVPEGGDRKQLERGLERLEKTPVHPEERLEARVMLARIERREGKRDEALARHLETLALADELRAHRSASDASRADWARRTADLAYETIAWLVEAGRAEDALRLGESIRARVLDDQLRAARVDWRAHVPESRRADLEARERTARADVASARRRLAAASGDDDARKEAEARLERAIHAWRDVEEEIRAASPAWRSAVASAREDPVASARAVLRGDEKLVLWETGREASHVFLLERTGPVKVARLAVPPGVAAEWGVPAGDLGDATLERVLREGVATIGGGEASGLMAPLRGIQRLTPTESREQRPAPPASRRQAELRRLADVLLPAGIRDEVLSAERIYVAPDGPLHRLPFEALVLGTSADGPVYWLDVGPPVVYAHSLGTLADLGARAPSTAPAALSVANPATGPDAEEAGLGPLPGTEREAAEFARAFGGLDVVLLAGEEAREEAVKKRLPTARVIHLGTHGLVEQDRDDLLAALVLASEPPGSPEDGYLHLFEVVGLPLDAEAVVLSACETKLGRRVRGEGVFALSRGFLAAGASRVVASLWAVSDDATAAVMESFFRRVAETRAAGGEADWSAALRDAKREVRGQEAFGDPFFWAPFVISGVS